MMDLGDGLNGHPKICHGGFVATMLDEVIGVLITLNLVPKMERLKIEGSRSQLNCFTACESGRREMRCRTQS
jgi:thioesterase superfamily protein 4